MNIKGLHTKPVLASIGLYRSMKLLKEEVSAKIDSYTPLLMTHGKRFNAY
ncbi:MAG: hypothetical protein Q8K42_05155 [Methylobacter sp.]|nr:hypothetical protein [Methylobacter sp.]